jgi:hypothetical protein
MGNEVRKHTFYEIAGRKVGCSVAFKNRVGQYRRQGETRPVEILFELECDPQTAGNVEWNLADLFDYPRGQHSVRNSPSPISKVQPRADASV